MFSSIVINPYHLGHNCQKRLIIGSLLAILCLIAKKWLLLVQFCYKILLWLVEPPMNKSTKKSFSEKERILSIHSYEELATLHAIAKILA